MTQYMSIKVIGRTASGDIIYASGDVYTSFNGKRVYVGTDYRSTSRSKLISQAIYNSQVRRILCEAYSHFRSV